MHYGAGFYLTIGVTLLCLDLLLLVIGVTALWQKRIDVSHHASITGRVAFLIGCIYVASGLSGIVSFAISSPAYLTAAPVTRVVADVLNDASIVGIGISVSVTLWVVLRRVVRPGTPGQS